MAEVLIHPAYFPSIEQMAVIAQATAIRFEKDDNYQKQTYRNRAYIAHSNGILLLNVPIKHKAKGLRQKYRDIKTENDFPWLKQHWKSIQTAYRTSPFFEFYEDDIAPIFSRKVVSLYEHNLFIYETLSDLIGIDLPFTFTEEYFRNPTDVVDARAVIEAKRNANFKARPYSQVFQQQSDFIDNLSVIDLLFNQGPNTLEYLETQSILQQ